jgi:hypothetical protein
MEIPPEERLRIYEEEKARIEGERRLTKNGGGRRVLVVALVIAGAFIAFWFILALQQAGVQLPESPGESEAPPPLAEQPSTPKGWVKIATFQGQSDKSTESFAVGQEWKIAWDTRAVRSPYTMLGIQIWRPGGGFVGAVAGNMGSEQDESVQHTPGTYYLQITASQPYTIEVWDRR